MGIIIILVFILIGDFIYTAEYKATDVDAKTSEDEIIAVKLK